MNFFLEYIPSEESAHARYWYCNQLQDYCHLSCKKKGGGTTHNNLSFLIFIGLCTWNAFFTAGHKFSFIHLSSITALQCYPLDSGKKLENLKETHKFMGRTPHVQSPELRIKANN